MVMNFLPIIFGGEDNLILKNLIFFLSSNLRKVYRHASGVSMKIIGGKCGGGGSLAEWGKGRIQHPVSYKDGQCKGSVTREK